MIKRTSRILLLLVILTAIYFLIVIIVGTFTRYRPDDIETISQIEDSLFINHSSTYSALIWNIGYAGLGAEMDFFYEGGKKVRDSEDNVRRNLYKITNWLKQNDTVDFILLQEVDINSKRSYSIDQLQHFNQVLEYHFPLFSANYNVKYVPVPTLRPLGKVHSGMLSFTRNAPSSSKRYSLPGDYSWPKNIFMPNRCFQINRYGLKFKNKELVLINIHNSAYDDGTLRKQQLDHLKDFLMEEENKGNFILVGGDWNQCPPMFTPEFNLKNFDTVNVSYIPDNFLDSKWQWVYDPKKATNRRVTEPYSEGKTLVTLIDFFLSSPNIEILKCKTIDMGFNYSDHQPVLLQFKLKI